MQRAFFTCLHETEPWFWGVFAISEAFRSNKQVQKTPTFVRYFSLILITSFYVDHINSFKQNDIFVITVGLCSFQDLAKNVSRLIRRRS
jgi:hypothetical protein